MKIKLKFEVVVDTQEELPRETVEKIAGGLGDLVLDEIGWTRDGATVLFKQDVFGAAWRGV